jgi:hypothetical protein
LEREQRRLKALDMRDEKTKLAALDADIKALIEMTDLVAHAALLAAGFRRYKRGEWRKRRGKPQPAEQARLDRREGIEETPGEGPTG